MFAAVFAGVFCGGVIHVNGVSRWGAGDAMESNHRYYARRALEELQAAARAVTPEARARRRALAEQFEEKARQCQREGTIRPAAAAELVSPAGFEPATY